MIVDSTVAASAIPAQFESPPLYFRARCPEEVPANSPVWYLRSIPSPLWVPCQEQLLKCSAAHFKTPGFASNTLSGEKSQAIFCPRQVAPVECPSTLYGERPSEFSSLVPTSQPQLSLQTRCQEKYLKQSFAHFESSPPMLQARSEEHSTVIRYLRTPNYPHQCFEHLVRRNFFHTSEMSFRAGTSSNECAGTAGQAV